jgi:hypothetical protein
VELEPRRTTYGPKGVAPGYFVSKAPWADEAGPSEFGEEDQRFPTLVNLMLRHGGTTEFAENILRSVKERAKEELPYWRTQKFCLLDTVLSEEALLEMDNRAEVEKWENVEELRLWLKHALDLSINIISKDLPKAFFINALLPMFFSVVGFRHTPTDICPCTFFLTI